MLTVVSQRSWRARSNASLLVACASGAAALVMVQTAAADMQLTAEGIAKGFALTTFATGFGSSGGVGPIGIDFQDDGTVLVTSYVGGTINRFNNTDNQTLAGAPALNYPADEFAHDVSHIGSTLYASRYNHQDLIALNADGSFNHTVASGIGNARANIVNPHTNHIYVSTVQGLREINPISGAVSNFASEESDGITLSLDGSVLYGAIISGPLSGHLIGYNTANGAKVFDSGFIGGGLDGTAIGFGERTGYIYGNLNNGSVIEINLNTNEIVTIATGGSRGDFCTADPTGSGDVLLTQSDRIMRLSGIPSPGVMAVGGIGMAGLLRRRR